MEPGLLMILIPRFRDTERDAQP